MVIIAYRNAKKSAHPITLYTCTLINLHPPNMRIPGEGGDTKELKTCTTGANDIIPIRSASVMEKWALF